VIHCNPPAASPPSVHDTIHCEAVLLARTVPEETRDGDVSICSAWWQPTLGLIRVYPMPLASRQQTWRRYRLELTRSGRDNRQRSFKLADGGPLDCTDTHSARDRLRARLEKMATATTISRLNEIRESLGVIRPVSGIDLDLERGEPDHSRSFGRKTFEVRPYLRFDDLDGKHRLALNEWGCYEFIRKGGDATQLNLRLDDPGREQLLLVGNLRDHPTTWVVIAAIGYDAVQPALFLQPPSLFDPLQSVDSQHAHPTA
jgi:hypothetical protein